MRLLVTIPHYFNPGAVKAADGLAHGSVTSDRATRVEALTRAIAALYQLFAQPQCQFRFDTWAIEPANTAEIGEVVVMVFTTGGHHLIPDLPRLAGPIWHFEVPVEPMMLGFECHAALRDRLGQFDMYAYLEDDLILHDPWFLSKLAWFNTHLGHDKLLQPNRYEVSHEGPVYKAYIDGEFPLKTTANFQTIADEAVLRSNVMGRPVAFRRASNPHSGCFFLNARQMAAWAARPDFLDRSTAFIGPLESAATLGIMRAFRVYKPVPEVASFLEIEHHGTAFLCQVRPDGRIK